MQIKNRLEKARMEYLKITTAKTKQKRFDGVKVCVYFEIATLFHSCGKKRVNFKTNMHLDSVESSLALPGHMDMLAPKSNSYRYF